jgi:plasmid stabilization system protein ParE
MTFAVVYTQETRSDIDAAFTWLASRMPNAAVDLLQTMSRAEEHLRRNPAIYRVIRTSPTGDIRRMNLRPFRYQLYFQIIEDKVIVIACLHASRSSSAHGVIVSRRSE